MEIGCLVNEQWTFDMDLKKILNYQQNKYSQAMDYVYIVSLDHFDPALLYASFVVGIRREIHHRLSIEW